MNASASGDAGPSTHPLPTLCLRGGTVVTSTGEQLVDVQIVDGRVAELGAVPDPRGEVVDVSGALVLPGMVDTHVHFMDPGDTTREDFPTGSAAAAVAGVTTVVEHTHAHPVRTTGDLASKRRHLEGRSHVDFGLAAHVFPERTEPLHELWEAGVTFFKVFLCTSHGIPGLSFDDLVAALEEVSACGGVALVHAEEESLTAAAECRLREEGRSDSSLLSAWRSRTAELVGAQGAALVARVTGARVVIAHVSHTDVLDVIDDVRARGANVGAEACPQYFLLREGEVIEHGPLRKFTPPARIRSTAEEDAMWQAVRDGRFMHFASDHAPSTLEQKSAGIWDAPFGLPGIDTTMRVLLDAARCGRISLPDVVRLYAETPARCYGLFPRKGTLKPGADADLLLVDPEAEDTLRHTDVISKAGWTPYEGRRVRGRVVRTHLRGREIARDGQVTAGTGGRFLAGAGARDHNGAA